MLRESQGTHGITWALGGMSDATRTLFVTLQNAIERWSLSVGHRDAYIRGSQARKDLAEQIWRYRAALGRRGFIERLREGLSKN